MSSQRRVSNSFNHLRAVLFDFDGTLADSYEAITTGVNGVRAELGLPSVTQPEVRPLVGLSLEYVIEQLIPVGDLPSNIRSYRRHYRGVMHQQTVLLPGASDLLTQLREAGLRVAVCTNKRSDYTRELIESLGIAERVELVVGPEDVPRRKPAPDMILAALEFFDVVSEQIVFVGDTNVDVQTARAAGVPVWVVPTGSEDAESLRRANPDRILRDLREAATLLPSR